MISPIEIVLIAVMATKNPFNGSYEMYYEPLDYYKSIAECNKEQARLTKKNQLGVRYICLPVDKD
jgi:hypothetical protein